MIWVRMVIGCAVILVVAVAVTSMLGLEVSVREMLGIVFASIAVGVVYQLASSTSEKRRAELHKDDGDEVGGSSQPREPH